MKPEDVIAAFSKGLVQAFLDAPSAEAEKPKKPKEKKEDVRQLVLETIAGLTSPAETKSQPAPSVTDLDNLIRAQRPESVYYHPDGGDLDEPETLSGMSG